MLEGHRVFKLKDATGGILEVEVNWSENKNVANCNLLRFTGGFGVYEIPRKELVSLMLLIGDVNDQKRMLPMKLTRIRKLERLLTFEFDAKKDYRKGEKIRVQAPWIDEVPDVEEVMSGNVKAKKRGIKYFTK